jgi:hypothetical protein
VTVHASGLHLQFRRHLAAIGGAPVGHLTMGGRWQGVLPPAARVVSAVSTVLMLAMSLIVLARSGAIELVLPAWCSRVVLGYLALAIVMHVATPSAAERKLWLPVILGLAAAAAWVEFEAP